MLPEISLNILDVAQNAVDAGASRICITAELDRESRTLRIVIEDNGRGMDARTLSKCTDPFFTTRSTRRIGLGLSFFKLSASLTGGEFSIRSSPGAGTCVSALYHTDHIDCMPLGDLEQTVCTLITLNPTLDICCTLQVDSRSFVLDTSLVREILGEEISLAAPEVTQFLRDCLREQKNQLLS